LAHAYDDTARQEVGNEGRWSWLSKVKRAQNTIQKNPRIAALTADWSEGRQTEHRIVRAVMNACLFNSIFRRSRLNIEMARPNNAGRAIRLPVSLLFRKFMRIVVGARFVRAPLRDGFRSQIISSPSLGNFRDPASRFRLLAKHRSGRQRQSAQAKQFACLTYFFANLCGL